jgi:hypothetical protein
MELIQEERKSGEQQQVLNNEAAELINNYHRLALMLEGSV